MSPTAGPSSASRGALYLVVIGAAGALIGLYFAATGLADVLAGHWRSVNGGIGSLIIGVALVAGGIFMGLRGRVVQRLLRRNP